MQYLTNRNIREARFIIRRRHTVEVGDVGQAVEDFARRNICVWLSTSGVCR